MLCVCVFMCLCVRECVCERTRARAQLCVSARLCVGACLCARACVHRSTLVELVRGLLRAPGVLFACEKTHEGKADEDERLKFGVGSHAESYALHKEIGTFFASRRVCIVSGSACVECSDLAWHRLF